MADKERDSDPNQKRRASDQVRLESWKAIANYLNRSVRTVRRWESSEKMPVYRIRHKKGFSVYAYRSDLDAWRQGQRAAFPESPIEGRPKRSVARIAPYGGIITGALFAIGLIAWLVLPGSLVQNQSGSPEIAHARGSEAAGEHIEIALDRSQLEHNPDLLESVTNILVMPVASAWQDGTPHDVLQEIELIRSQLPEYPAAYRTELVAHLLDTLLSMGRVEEAADLLATVDDPQQRHEMKSSLLFAMGRVKELRTHLEYDSEFNNKITPLFMAIAGLFDEALEMEGNLNPSVSDSGRAKLIRALSLLRAGKENDAKALLQEALTKLDVSDQGFYFVAMDLLSGLLKSDEQLGEAINTLEVAGAQRKLALLNQSGLFWTMCQRQLANLYRDAGRTPDAVRVEDALRNQLSLADEKSQLAQSLEGV